MVIKGEVGEKTGACGRPKEDRDGELTELYFEIARTY